MPSVILLGLEQLLSSAHCLHVAVSAHIGSKVLSFLKEPYTPYTAWMNKDIAIFLLLGHQALISSLAVVSEMEFSLEQGGTLQLKACWDPPQCSWPSASLNPCAWLSTQFKLCLQNMWDEGGQSLEHQYSELLILHFL